MFTRLFLCTSAAVLLVLLLLPSQSWSRNAEMSQAAREHREGRWSAAYGRLVTALRQDEPEAAELSDFMQSYGELLYGTSWDFAAVSVCLYVVDRAAAHPCGTQRVMRDSALQRAASLYRAQQWGSAFDAFARLADKGHPDAARIALVMHRHGPALYGHYWLASPNRTLRWSVAAEGTNAPPLKSPKTALER